ncbi:hypothetical protein FOVG_19622 [Fusarium oxysporum f. sp. pisi HDV247]|uniref:Uncharacterized protein n=1 Tax=Fusarium oxysporum f. sp. pisi HDV247 TaxID=1080344 RepID=W9NFQ8_FUSOX|nr:hypothetical protein FOVG_19622 [Fusarium oxysporum f. sp. pisi HDV247]
MQHIPRPGSVIPRLLPNTFAHTLSPTVALSSCGRLRMSMATNGLTPRPRSPTILPSTIWNSSRARPETGTLTFHSQPTTPTCGHDHGPKTTATSAAKWTCTV